MFQQVLSKTSKSFLPEIKNPRSRPLAKPQQQQVQQQKEQKEQKKAVPTFQTIKKLSKAKFSVYLVNCEAINQQFAMKVFPYKEGRVNPCFITEARFANLNHQNVIKIIGYEPSQETVSDNKVVKVSYLISEFAPHGDFHDVVVVKGGLTDEKLVRTYFRQLIEGIEYLHSNNVAHLDLKLENLLLGKDFKLKIADFDLSHVRGDPKINTRGTVYYRAPELLDQKCVDVEAADVYAAGIILFVFKSGGILPHSERQLYKGMNLFNMIHEENTLFWQKHCEIQGKSQQFFDTDFRRLFNACVSVDPSERPSIAEIKKSKWYNGPVYSPQEYSKLMAKNLKVQT